MADLTATEKLERARRSIMVAEERLNVINNKLPGLNCELDDLIVINETQGYKGRTIERLQAEIDSLQKEKETLEKTISALQKALPEFEKAWRLELAGTESLDAYRSALKELTGLLHTIPAIDELREAIRKAQTFSDKLDESQRNFFAASLKLNDTLLQEDIESIGDVSIECLQSDALSLNYGPLLSFSDDLIDIGEQINELQFSLFKVGTAQLIITAPPAPVPVPEYSPCGNYYRIKQGGKWYLFKRERRPEKNGYGFEDFWSPGIESANQPEFPFEPEFSPDGRFRIERKNGRWLLFQKIENGQWSKMRESETKPDFPVGPPIPIEEKTEEPSNTFGQLAYGNEAQKFRDPDEKISSIS
ncbi:MAG TPA: hypothetical protein DD713_08240 [Nitrospiraceae bacterium]|nr:hypothetical protein [Nitrospiraceae bacterium]